MNEITVKIPCVDCGRVIEIKVKESDYSEWMLGTTKHVQDVFPYLTAGEREMFITGICEDCFHRIFAGEEAEEEM